MKIKVFVVCSERDWIDDTPYRALLPYACGTARGPILKYLRVPRVPSTLGGRGPSSQSVEVPLLRESCNRLMIRIPPAAFTQAEAGQVPDMEGPFPLPQTADVPSPAKNQQLQIEFQCSIALINVKDFSRRLFARPSSPETPRLTLSLALFHESLWIISIPFQQMPPPHRAAIANETHYQTSFRRLWTNHGLSISIEMWWARYFCKFRGVLSASLNCLLEVGTERQPTQSHPGAVLFPALAFPEPARTLLLACLVCITVTSNTLDRRQHPIVPRLDGRSPLWHSVSAPAIGRRMYAYAAVPLYPCLCLPYFIVTVYLTSTIPDQLVTAQCDRRRTRGLILDCKRIPESLTSLVLESPPCNLGPRICSISTLDPAPFIPARPKSPLPTSSEETKICRICHDTRRVDHVISLRIWRDGLLTHIAVRLAAQRFCAVCYRCLPSVLHIAVVIPHFRGVGTPIRQIHCTIVLMLSNAFHFAPRASRSGWPHETTFPQFLVRLSSLPSNQAKDSQAPPRPSSYAYSYDIIICRLDFETTQATQATAFLEELGVYLKENIRCQIHESGDISRRLVKAATTKQKHNVVCKVKLRSQSAAGHHNALSLVCAIDGEGGVRLCACDVEEFITLESNSTRHREEPMTSHLEQQYLMERNRRASVVPVTNIGLPKIGQVAPSRKSRLSRHSACVESNRPVTQLSSSRTSGLLVGCISTCREPIRPVMPLSCHHGRCGWVAAVKIPGRGAEGDAGAGGRVDSDASALFSLFFSHTRPATSATHDSRRHNAFSSNALPSHTQQRDETRRADRFRAKLGLECEGNLGEKRWDSHYGHSLSAIAELTSPGLCAAHPDQSTPRLTSKEIGSRDLYFVGSCFRNKTGACAAATGQLRGQIVATNAWRVTKMSGADGAVAYGYLTSRSLPRLAVTLKNGAKGRDTAQRGRGNGTIPSLISLQLDTKTY
ncbi:uncharacterized protein CLUP02_10242 [Colletotrichum lupini]|uniref:Uncharacterized protein n=1 Tax=Colletotrichum lupini TaxID=145971 RepID=A0A9Q8SXY3_9PEZI|nr:uncharacterized protein CLUP02_10242 [Colletotrichum lupini]UQC84746.1 hypothetical protein CLUP02_10242 [Colletotrichum lupini]